MLRQNQNICTRNSKINNDGTSDHDAASLHKLRNFKPVFYDINSFYYISILSKR